METHAPGTFACPYPEANEIGFGTTPVSYAGHLYPLGSVICFDFGCGFCSGQRRD